MSAKEDKCKIYDYGCRVKHGEEIKFEISVHPQNYAEDIQTILNNNNTSSIEKLIEESKQKEDKLLAKYKALLVSEYGELANQTRLYMLALEASKAIEITPIHTNNQWIPKRDGSTTTVETISNATYKMYFRVYECTKYINGVDTPVAWEVTWLFTTNSPLPDRIHDSHSRGIENKTLDAQYRKKYTDKGALLKYIEGRKKAFAKYFTEEYPLIPKACAESFMMNGILLPNYKVED